MQDLTKTGKSSSNGMSYYYFTQVGNNLCLLDNAGLKIINPVDNSIVLKQPNMHKSNDSVNNSICLPG